MQRSIRHIAPQFTRNIIRYAVISAMIAVAVLGLPIIFPYHAKSEDQRPDTAQSSLLVDA